ncbi:MAG: alpha/beta fold hydrolase [Egibacteraceae bacterium]
MVTPEFDSCMASVNGIRMHYVRAGSGPLVVLLHGWPQTWFMWRKLIPVIAARYTVVAPDLRGYGLSDKPPTGYDKRTMASDIGALVRHLGFDRLALVGHDRGARVAHRYGLDRPGEVEGIVVLDIIPTREVVRRTDAMLARGYWHWFFHLQPDLPEQLAGRDVEGYLRYFFERWTYNRPPVEEAVPTYVQAFSRPGALRAAFDDYRATFPDDIEADDASVEAGDRLHMPLLALWGEVGLTARLPVLDIWHEYASNARGEAIPECGHFLPEEQPELVAERIMAFLDHTPLAQS